MIDTTILGKKYEENYFFKTTYGDLLRVEI